MESSCARTLTTGDIPESSDGWPKTSPSARQIYHLPLVDQLDSPGPNDVEELRRLTARLQDHLIGTVELDVGVLDDLGEPFLAQLVERRVDAQEGGDVHGLKYRTGAPRWPQRKVLMTAARLAVSSRTDVAQRGADT